jgi:hypothetical protein
MTEGRIKIEDNIHALQPGQSSIEDILRNVSSTDNTPISQRAFDVKGSVRSVVNLMLFPKRGGFVLTGMCA